MRHSVRRVLIIILFFAGVPALCLDALLWHLDPLGTRRMVYNWITLAEVDMPHPTGYQYPAGMYNLGFYTVTIIEDGKRLVPASGNGACTIAFIGDSVTWGQGVNDSETFVNRLAEYFPHITVWNTARNRYSVTNITAALAHYAADGYVWTMISNDTQPFALPETYTRLPSATELYITTWVAEYRYARQLKSLTWGEYAPLAQSIVERPDVLTFGFEDDPLVQEAQAWGVIQMPYPAHTVSVADKHPNAAGHQQIAASMLPAITTFMERVC